MTATVYVGKVLERIGRHFIPSGSRTRSNKGKLLKSCIVQLVIIAILAMLIMLTTEMRFGAVIAAAAVWTVILCFTPAFNLWFIKPQANTAVVLASALARETALVTEEQLTKLQPSRTMRVVYGPTFDGKDPWEEIVNGQVINLLRSITLGTPLNATTKDNVKVRVSWRMFLSVIQCDKCIINLARHNEEKIKETFTRGAEAYIQSTIRTMTVNDLFHEIYEDPDSNIKIPKGQVILKKGFSNLHGGDMTIDAEEEEMGMRTSKLIIYEIELDEAYQRALQSEATAEKAIGAIKKYKLEAGVSADVAANLNAADRGIEQPAAVSSHYFYGLGPNTHVVVGDVEGRGKGGKR